MFGEWPGAVPLHMIVAALACNEIEVRTFAYL